MYETSNIKGHFLIAMPSMTDPHFFQAVAYVLEHNKDGAMGVVINKPMDLHLGDLLKHLDIHVSDDPDVNDQFVLMGGPVSPEQGFILHTIDTVAGRKANELMITASREMLRKISEGKGPEKTLVSLGHAGWAADQLEEELANNVWLTAPANQTIIFDVPFGERWREAAKIIGVDVDCLSGDVGHA